LRLFSKYEASPNIIRVTKSRRMIWTVHVASMADTRNAYGILVENLKGRDNLEDLGIDGKIRIDFMEVGW